MPKTKVRYFRILDWGKWYPHNLHSIPWIKLSSKIFETSIFVGQDPRFLFSYIYFLTLAAKFNRDGAFIVHTDLWQSCVKDLRKLCQGLFLTFALNNELLQELSEESYRTFAPQSKEVRSKKKETTLPLPPQGGGVSEGLILLWNEIFPTNKVMYRTAHRGKLAREAWAENPSMDSWRDIFQKVKKTTFLTGGSKTGWQADFDWVMKNGNWARIADGSFENKHDEPWTPKEERENV